MARAPVTFARTTLIVLTALHAWALGAGPAQAVTHSVNTTVDQSDFIPGDTICDSDPETEGDQCTVRAAVEDAGGIDTSETSFVEVPSGTYHLSLGVIAIAGNLDLKGAGARNAIIRQTTLDRVFYTGGTVNLSGTHEGLERQGRGARLPPPQERARAPRQELPRPRPRTAGLRPPQLPAASMVG